jgi:hypothetical protein
VYKKSSKVYYSANELFNLGRGSDEETAGEGGDEEPIEG